MRCPTVVALRRVPREYRPMVRAAVAAGWRLVPKRRHLLLYAPTDDGTTVCVPGSPSDRRSLLNTRAQLRRAGVAI